jgi:muramidase (phage lysozyme)
MSKLPFIIFGVIVIAGVAITLSGNAMGQTDSDDEVTPNPFPESNNQGDYTDTMITNFSQHPLLQLIQKRESGGRYDIVFGGGKFSDFSTHPYAGWRVDTAPIGNGELTRKGVEPAVITVGVNAGKRSSAAGRYQFVLKTWIRLARQINNYDFSMETQDKLAYRLCVNIGAIELYAAGDLPGAIRKCATQWTSLPGSGTGESSVSMQIALRELQSYV